MSPKQSSCVALHIRSQSKNLGDFSVRRLLPSGRRQKVGPFVFFDHMGPAVFPPGHGINVRPHPHIGLATVTYLFEGQIMHRDSLGVVQPIESGAVNLMTAGRGIVHSERAGDDFDRDAPLHGIQSWMALPKKEEECAPEFTHYPATDLPRFEHDGAHITVIIGEVFGRRSPVVVRGDMLYLDVQLPAGASLSLPEVCAEMGLYVVEGSVTIDANAYVVGDMVVATPGLGLIVNAASDSRFMVLGGQTISERHIWWNFVSSSLDRIEQAKKDWKEGRFEAVPGDDEFIPLP